MKFSSLKIGILITCFLLSATVWAQKKTITGKVTSNDGSPLAGATIIVHGNKNGTQTNADGDFSIDANSGSVLDFSSVGFVPQSIKVGSSATINVSLQLAADKLNEVVVVGYGTQKRTTLSGAVASVNKDVIKNAVTSNIGTVLQGTVTGLTVQQSTGQPGTTPSIIFRGGTNFDGSGTPLYVLDGVIIPSLYGVNMDDVASIDVLKDAGSTAIYGARASNGVVLITTKKGKMGKAQVSYTIRQTENYIRRNPLDYLSAAQYIHWNRLGIGSRYQADLADGNTNAANNDKNQNTGAWGWALSNGWKSPIGLYSTQLVSDANRNLIGNNLWNLLIDPNPFVAGQMDSILFRNIDVKTRENMILQKQTTQEHYLNFSGASQQGNFDLGLGITHDNGIIIGSSLKRLSMNFNGGLNVGKNLKVTMNTSAYTVSQSLPYTNPSGGGTGGLMQRFIGVAPTVRYTNDTSGAILPGPNDVTLGNPNYWSQLYVNSTNQQRLIGSLNLVYSILPSLKFLASGSGYLQYTNNNYFTKAYQAGNGGSIITTRPASFNNTNDVQYSYNAFLQYDKSFGDHKLTVLGGSEFYDFTEHTFAASASGAPTDFIPWLNASLPASITNGVIVNPVNANSDFNQWDRLASIIGRINYSYQDRYFLTANFRYDGTSRLAAFRYGLFPGISAGWNMQNEKFFQKSVVSKYISVFKPRISWGQNGSIAAFDPSKYGDLFAFYPTAQVYQNAGIYNGQGGTYYPTYINSDLKWETSTTTNFGADIGLFDNRISIIGDYFIRNVFDKIATQPVSIQTGFSGYTTNLGQLQNRGIELNLKASIIRPTKEGGLSLDFAANYYKVKNYAIKLPNNGLPGNRQGTFQVWNSKGQLQQVGGLVEGQRIGSDEVWAPSYDGIYKTQDQITKDANVYNTYLPYTHKNLHLLGDAIWHQVYQNDTIDQRQFVYVGRTTPDVTGGFTANVGYKGFSLYAQFDYALNFVILNNEKLRGLSQVQGSQNSTVDVLNTWTPDNPNATLPRFYWANQGRNYATDASGNNPFAQFWEKGDYLMLRTVTLSYEMSHQLLEQAFKNKVQGFRLFVTGSNLSYFTKYSGNFPEIGGVDPGKYPLPRSLTLGANVTF
jgi:TonB-linked SusC/RagA family outer membrane protein